MPDISSLVYVEGVVASPQMTDIFTIAKYGLQTHQAHWTANKGTAFREGIFKFLRCPTFVHWRAGTTTLFLLGS